MPKKASDLDDYIVATILADLFDPTGSMTTMFQQNC